MRKAVLCEKITINSSFPVVRRSYIKSIYQKVLKTGGHTIKKYSKSYQKVIKKYSYLVATLSRHPYARFLVPNFRSCLGTSAQFSLMPHFFLRTTAQNAFMPRHNRKLGGGRQPPRTQHAMQAKVSGAARKKAPGHQARGFAGTSTRDVSRDVSFLHRSKDRPRCFALPHHQW